MSQYSLVFALAHSRSGQVPLPTIIGKLQGCLPFSNYKDKSVQKTN